MKKLFLFITLYINIIITIFSQELLIGSNLSDYVVKNIEKYDQVYVLGPAHAWNDIILRYSYDSNESAATLVSYQQIGQIGGFFGVLLGKSPNAYYLLDTDNDNILDKKSEYLIIPYWILIPKHISNDDKNIKEYFDALYISFQDKYGPNGINSQLNKARNMLLNAIKNEDTVNRDIYYMMDSYNGYCMAYPDVALSCIKSLKNVFYERFGYVHIVLHLYHIETLLNNGRRDEARLLLKEYSKDSDFIPLKAYSYLLEIDEQKRREKRNDLIKNYSDHWMVKRIINQ